MTENKLNPNDAVDLNDIMVQARRMRAEALWGALSGAGRGITTRSAALTHSLRLPSAQHPARG